MKLRLHHALALASVAAIAACSGGSNGQMVPAASSAAAPMARSGSGNVKQSCATMLRGDTMRCYAEFRTDTVQRLGIIENATPVGLRPVEPPSGVQSAVVDRGERPDDRHRRCLQRSQRRGRSRGLSFAVRAAGVLVGQRLL